MNYTLEIPCKRDCKGRSATCHGKCEAYAEFVRKNEERKKNKLEELEIGDALIKNARRMQKVKKKRKKA